MLSNPIKMSNPNNHRILPPNASNAKKFNHNLLRLMDQLENYFPEDNDLAFFKDKLALLCKVNTKMPSELFVWFVDDKIEPIMKRDVEYFINLDHKERLENAIKNNMMYNDRDYLGLIDKVIGIYRETDNTKVIDIIGKYLEVLMCYGIRTMRRQDLLDEMNKYRKNPLTL